MARHLRCFEFVPSDRAPSRFRPTHKVEIFDRGDVGHEGAPVKIAELLSDGIHGRIRVLDERFRGLIEGLFSLGSLVMEREPSGAESAHADLLVPSEAYSLDGIRQVVEHELAPHNLSAAVLGLD